METVQKVRNFRRCNRRVVRLSKQPDALLLRLASPQVVTSFASTAFKAAAQLTPLVSTSLVVRIAPPELASLRSGGVELLGSARRRMIFVLRECADIKRGQPAVKTLGVPLADGVCPGTDRRKSSFAHVNIDQSS